MAASAWDRTSVAAPKASRENIASKVCWVKILSINPICSFRELGDNIMDDFLIFFPASLSS